MPATYECNHRSFSGLGFLRRSGLGRRGLGRLGRLGRLGGGRLGSL